jgi:hypothetical protein
VDRGLGGSPLRHQQGQAPGTTLRSLPQRQHAHFDFGLVGRSHTDNHALEFELHGRRPALITPKVIIAPTVSFIATDIYRIANGQIAESWYLEDNLTFLQQIGVVAQ